MIESQCEVCRLYIEEIELCNCPEDLLGLECPYMDFMYESPDSSGALEDPE